MRLALGDELIEGTWGFEDAQIAAILKQPIILGVGPEFIGLSGDNLDPDPNAKEVGYLILKAAQLFFSVQTGSSWRTRAVSLSESPQSIATINRNLQLRIQELEEGGGIRDESGTVDEGVGIFGASGHWSTWASDLATELYGTRTLA